MFDHQNTCIGKAFCMFQLIWALEMFSASLVYFYAFYLYLVIYLSIIRSVFP